MVESSEGFISLGSEGILHNLITDVINEFNINTIEEYPSYNALINLYNFLNGIAQSEPYNENSQILTDFKKPKNLMDAYADVEILFKYTLKRGFMTIPEKPASWEDNELEILPSLPTKVEPIVKDKDLEILFTLMKEDREDEMTNNQITAWINNYNLYLNLYQQPFVELKVRNKNTKESASRSLNPLYVIERLFLRKGKCGILYGGQGAGKSNFLTWLIGIVLLYNKKWFILSNVPLFTDREELSHLTPDRVIVVHKLSETLNLVAKLIIEGKIPVILIDEIDQDVNSHKWQGKRTQSLYNLVLIMRHLKIRMILFYHDFKHIPEWLRNGDLAGEYVRLIEMPNSKNHFAFSENTQPFSFFIPISWIPYATHGWNGFDIDVFVSDLSRKLNGITPIELAKSLIKIIPTLDYIDPEKNKERKKLDPETQLKLSNEQIDNIVKSVESQRTDIKPKNWKKLPKKITNPWERYMSAMLSKYGLSSKGIIPNAVITIMDKTGEVGLENNFKINEYRDYAESLLKIAFDIKDEDVNNMTQNYEEDDTEESEDEDNSDIENKDNSDIEDEDNSDNNQSNNQKILTSI